MVASLDAVSYMGDLYSELACSYDIGLWRKLGKLLAADAWAEISVLDSTCC